MDIQHHALEALRAINVSDDPFDATNAVVFVLGHDDSRTVITEYDTIHKMLRLEEIDVFLLMGGAIGVSLPLLWWLERRNTTTALAGRLTLSRSKPQRHHVIGGALFGIGWAVSGTCPAPALVMLVSGAGLAIVTIIGLFIGLNLRDAQVRRSSSTVTVGDGEHRDVAVVS